MQGIYLHLFRCPSIKINRLDFADMGTHSTVNTRTADAQKDTTSEMHEARCKENGHQKRTYSMTPSGDLSTPRGQKMSKLDKEDLPLCLQSAQTLFVGRLISSLRTRACLSVVALSCGDMADVV